jgi:iron complex outermembrane receptor protein
MNLGIHIGASQAWARPCCALLLASLHHHACAQLPAPTQAEASAQRIVVTATRFPTSLSRLPGGVQIITAEQIASAGAKTVNEALMRVLGIQGRLDLSGGGNYQLDLRGFGETSNINQVVILDGLRLSEPDTSATRLSGIPIESVERIEVLRGSSAVLYGEGATGGAIVITTRAGGPALQAAASSWQGSLTAGAGNMSSREGSAWGRWSQGGWTWDASVQKAGSDNHRPNARSTSGSGEVGTSWRGGGWTFGLKHSHDETDARLPGGLPYADYLLQPFASLPDYRDDHGEVVIRRTQAYAQGTSGDWLFSLEMAASQRDVKSYTTSKSFGGVQYDYGVDADDLTLKAQREWKVGGWGHRTQFGWERRRWGRQDNFSGQADSDVQGGFLRHEVDLASKLSVTAGLRLDSVRRSASFSAPLASHPRAWEGGISYPLSGSLVAWGRAGSSYRVASVDELQGQSFQNLRAQMSRDRETGLRWARDSSLVEVRAYRNALTDEIAYDPGLFRNVNLYPTLRQGLEADLALPIGQAWRLQSSFAWRLAEFRSGPQAGRSIPLASRRTASLRAVGKLGAPHQLSGGLHWADASFVDVDNTCRVPARATLDVRYAYTWQAVEMSLAVANLADRRYFTSAFGCTAGQPSNVYPEPGRTLSARVRVNF